MDYKVYVHICKEKNEYGNYGRYYGITSQKLQNRWKHDGIGYKKRNKNGKYVFFWNAIVKHGWDNFEHKLLIHGLTREQALKWEKRLVKYFKTNNKKYGYNSTSGGDNFTHTEETKNKIKIAHIGKIVKKETKEKLRIINTGKHLSEESRKKMSLARQGMYAEDLNPMFGKNKELNPFFGKKHTEQSKNKISIANKNRKEKYDNKPIRVRCIETGRIYNSIGEANKACNTSHVSECCNGKRNISGGYHWEYVDKT